MSEFCGQRNSMLRGLPKKMDDDQMSLFAVKGYIEFYCQKSVDFFWVCKLDKQIGDKTKKKD